MNVLLLAAESAEHAAPHVETWITVLFGLILVAMIASLALEEKIHAKKSIIVGTFAGLCLILGTLLGLLPFGKVHLPNGHEIEIVDADPRRIKRLRLRLRSGNAVLGQAAE